MRILFVSLTLILIGCNMPHPTSGLTQRGKAQIGEFSFVVNWNSEKAEVSRTNFYPSRVVDPVHAAAVVATEQVTGCKVRPNSLRGDVALIKVRLACDGKEATPYQPECAAVAVPTYTGSDVFQVDFFCEY